MLHRDSRCSIFRTTVLLLSLLAHTGLSQEQATSGSPASVPEASSSTSAPAQVGGGRVYSAQETWALSNGRLVLESNPAVQSVLDALSSRSLAVVASSSSQSTSNRNDGTQGTRSGPTASMAESNAPPPASTAASDGGQSNGMHEVQPWTKFDKVVVAHATIGSVAWLVISPIAIVVARMSRKQYVPISLHQWLQTAGTALLTLVAVILGGIATTLNHNSHFGTAHQRMGLVLLILVVLQVLLGRIIYQQTHGQGRYRSAGEIIHIALAFVLTGMGFAQIYLGMQLYERRTGRATPLAVKIIWAIIVGVTSLWLIIASIRTAVGKDRSQEVEREERMRRRGVLSRVTQHQSFSWEHVAHPTIDPFADPPAAAAAAVPEMQEHRPDVHSPTSLQHSLIPIPGVAAGSAVQASRTADQSAHNHAEMGLPTQRERGSPPPPQQQQQHTSTQVEPQRQRQAEEEQQQRHQRPLSQETTRQQPSIPAPIPEPTFVTYYPRGTNAGLPREEGWRSYDSFETDSTGQSEMISTSSSSTSSEITGRSLNVVREEPEPTSDYEGDLAGTSSGVSLRVAPQESPSAYYTPQLGGEGVDPRVRDVASQPEQEQQASPQQSRASVVTPTLPGGRNSPSEHPHERVVPPTQSSPSRNPSTGSRRDPSPSRFARTTNDMGLPVTTTAPVRRKAVPSFSQE